MNFEANTRVRSLKNASDEFRVKGGVVNDHAHIDFLNLDEKAILQEKFRPSLYKVFLFQHIAGAIKAGNLNLSYSYKYRPMDAYLIDKKRWAKEKIELMQRAGLTEFADPVRILDLLKDALTKQYKTTNAKAQNNSHLSVRGDGSFHIKTPAIEISDADPLDALFPDRHDVPLAQVLETINGHTNMLSAFEHWQQTHIRQTVSRPALLAGIMGLGCGIGVRKMARISSRVTENELEHSVPLCR